MSGVMIVVVFIELMEGRMYVCVCVCVCLCVARCPSDDAGEDRVPSDCCVQDQ